MKLEKIASMVPSPTPPPVTPAPAAIDSEQVGLFDTDGNVFGDPGQFDLQPGRTTGEMWTLNFHCKGALAKNEFLYMEIDWGDITYYNLLSLKSKLGYAARDFLYYKKRCGRDVARLEVIDFDHQAETMVANGEGERKARLLLTKEQPKEMQASISPMKRTREKPIRDEDGIHDILDEYKIWLRDLKKDYPDTDLKDDFRDHTIETYKEWLNAQGLMEHIVSSSEDSINDIDERSTSPKERPSHARRATYTDKDCRQPNKKIGRGTLKGLAAAMKRIRSGSHKLEIEFSKKTGGPVGINHRSFVDEVSVFTRQKAPLIGVRYWNDIDKDVKRSLASDILSRWELKDTMDAEEKILFIAN